MEKWICPECNESIEPQFDTCWNCSFNNRDKANKSKSVDENISMHANEGKIEDKKIGKLSIKYRSLRNFQSIMWFLYFLLCISMIWSFIYTLDKIPVLTISSFSVLLFSYLLTIFVVLYFVMTISKIINFLFDLDDKNNE